MLKFMFLVNLIKIVKSDLLPLDLNFENNFKNFELIFIHNRAKLKDIEFYNIQEQMIALYRETNIIQNCQSFCVHLSYHYSEHEFGNFLNEIKEYFDTLNGFGSNSIFILNLNFTLNKNVQFPKFRLDSNVYLIENSNLYEVYSIRENIILAKFQIKSGNLDCYKILEKNIRRSSSFKNVEIRAIQSDYIPGYEFVAKKNVDPTTGEVYYKGGYFVEKLWILRDSLKFKERAMMMPIDPKDPFNSTLVKMHIREDLADITYSHFQVTELIAESFSILHLIHLENLLAYFKQPQVNTLKNVFIAPFYTKLWIFIGIFWIIFVLLGILFTLIVSRKIKLPILKALSDYTMHVFGIQTNQGADNESEDNSIRLLLISALIFGFLTNAYYSSIIIYNLSRKVITIKEFQDLKDWKFNIYPDVSHGVGLEIFNEFTSKKYPNVYKLMIFTDGVVENILHTNVKSTILTTQLGIVSFFKTKNIPALLYCRDISKVPIKHRYVTGSMLVKKGSPLKDIFNIKTLVAKERGIEKKTSFYQIPDITTINCDPKSEFESAPLVIGDVFMAYMIFVGGVLFAVFIIICEICNERNGFTFQYLE